MEDKDMKRSVVLCAGILILALIPGLASAQGWLLPGLPGLPSFGSSGCGSCYDNLGGLTIGGDVAYVGYPRATTVEFVSQVTTGVVTQFNWKHGYPVHGIQLSATAIASPNDRITAIARGTWLLPWNGESFENYEFGAAKAERKWTAKTQWWTVEGAGAFSMNAWGAIVAGLRYDSLQTSFKDPSEATLLSFVGQEADLQVNLWIPYAGVIARQGRVTFGIIGSPWVPGHLRYGQTNSLIFVPNSRLEGSGSTRSGYFFETWAEFNVNLMGAAAGLFAKYTYVHVRVEDSLTSAFSVFTNSGQLEITFDRPNWIFGAQATLNFRSPL